MPRGFQRILGAWQSVANRIPGRPSRSTNDGVTGIREREAPTRGTFQSVTGRVLSELETTTPRDRLLRTMRVIWADVGLTHPSFKKQALELSEKGAAKLGITQT